MKPYRRKEILINPKFQLKIVAIFLLPVVVVSAVNFVALINALSDLRVLVGKAPHSEEIFQILDSFTLFFVISNSVLTALLLVLGVLSTFRIAGPLHKLKEIVSKSTPEDMQELKFRKDDMLQDVSETYNKNIHKFKK